MVMVLPGSPPSPLNSGRVSSVTPPLVIGPVMSPASSMTLPMTGFPGAVLSTVNSKGSEGLLGLPASSVSVTVTECEPSVSGVSGVTLQLPSGLTVPVPMTTPPCQ